MNIYVKPDEIWDYFQKNKKHLEEVVEVIAEVELDDKTKLQVCITEDSGYPKLTLELEDDVPDVYDISDFVTSDSIVILAVYLSGTACILTVPSSAFVTHFSKSTISALTRVPEPEAVSPKVTDFPSADLKLFAAVSVRFFTSITN